MIVGFDKLQKQLKDAQKAFRELDGTIATLKFDPHNAASVLAAVSQMENRIDGISSRYVDNQLVQSVASGLKENFRQKIEDRAAKARQGLERGTMMADELPAILRQIDNTVGDLQWADRSSFARHIKKLSGILHSEDLAELVEDLTDGIDLEGWIKEGLATQGGTIGSAELRWPSEQKKEFGTIVLLIHKFADDPDGAIDFAFTFFHTGNNYVQNLQHMAGQVLVPFARDFIDYVRDQNASPRGSTRVTEPDTFARKVFLVHGHDEGAREGVARVLEKLSFEVVILHEQANQGRTIIEKFEAHSDVGFAVVLLTADDEGGVKGGDMQPRARQNVILELGYFIGQLGRNRVMALKRGDVEIPSDFHGIVWVSMGNDGAWKSDLGRELQAAGFDIDWNELMR